MDMSNMYRKFGEIWTCGFRDTQADRETYRQNRITFKLIAIHRLLIGSEVLVTDCPSHTAFPSSVAGLTQLLPLAPELCLITSSQHLNTAEDLALLATVKHVVYFRFCG